MPTKFTDDKISKLKEEFADIKQSVSIQGKGGLTPRLHSLSAASQSLACSPGQTHIHETVIQEPETRDLGTDQTPKSDPGRPAQRDQHSPAWEQG